MICYTCLEVLQGYNFPAVKCLTNGDGEHERGKQSSEESCRTNNERLLWSANEILSHPGKQ